MIPEFVKTREKTRKEQMERVKGPEDFWVHGYYALMIGTKKRAERIKNANKVDETPK